MAESSNEDVEKPDNIPVWARDDAFPLKPDGADFGVIDAKGIEHFASDTAELAKKVAGLRSGIDLVWTTL